MQKVCVFDNHVKQRNDEYDNNRWKHTGTKSWNVYLKQTAYKLRIDEEVTLPYVFLLQFLHHTHTHTHSKIP